MDIPLLPDIVAIFCLSIGVLLVCHQVKIPPIVGFLLTGSWFGIGWLVDMISILTGHFRDCEGLKLAK